MRLKTYYYLTLLAILVVPFGTAFAQSDCSISAGQLTLEDGSTARTYCLDQTNDEEVEIVSTGMTMEDGTQFQYFITNAGATITRIPTDGPPFSLSGFSPGGILIWKVAYTGSLIGDGLGDNLCLISSTSGCVSLSNPVVITRFRTTDSRCDDMEECMVNGGSITLDGGSTDTTICVSNGPAPLAVTTTQAPMGDSSTFLITDNTNRILAIPGDDGPFDLTGAGAGTCLIYTISYDASLTGLTVGNSVEDFDGCFALSNPITVTRNAGGDCDGATDFIASLSGTQELPCPVTTLGNGSVTATLNGNTLTVSGSFSDLESDFNAQVAGGAHLHSGLAGMAGPIIFPLTTDLDGDSRGGSFSAADNVFELSDDQVNTLRAFGLYVNIHSVDYPTGEIRGQLVPAADDYAIASLTGANENPSVNTNAYGGVTATLDDNTLTLSGSFTGLQGAIATQIGGGAHIHTGIAGRNGPVIFALTMDIDDDGRGATFPAAANSFELSDDQVAALDMEMLYVNVHSAFESSGEIRGQLLPYSTATFYVEMSGHQARPEPKNTTGAGKLLINYDGDETITVSGSLDDVMSPIATEIMGGGHLHLGLAGESGPISFPLNLTLDDDELGAVLLPGDNTFTVTAEQVDAFYDRGYYANFHTDDAPSGEIRGQVLNWAMRYFGSNLAGINENPEAVKTPGSGFVLYEVCNNKVSITGSFANLSSDFDADVAGGSHLHFGDAASNGPIFQQLAVDLDDDLRSGEYSGDDNVYDLTDNQLAALISGGAYFNLHTTDFAAGEIRGQILNDDDAFPTGPTIITPEDGETVTVSKGNSTLDDGVFNAASDPDGDILVYTIEVTAPDDMDFSDIIACEKVGTDTLSNATLDAVYDTLIAFGAVPGLSVPLRYRVVASDGSVATPGPSRTITLVVGEDMTQDTTMEANEFTASLSGTQELPCPVTTGASGTVNASLDGNTLTVSGSYRGLESDLNTSVQGGHHLHLGVAGMGGPIIFVLTGDTDADQRGGTFAAADNVFELSDDQVTALRDYGIYVNIHSVDRPTGEIRGQLVATSDDYAIASLTGANENPSISTNALGGVVATLNGDTLTVSGAFSGLQGAVATEIAGGAHIHMGIAGRNGPVIFPLVMDLSNDGTAATFPADSNVFILNDGQLEAFDNQMLYVNVHSAFESTGEIRGQLLPNSVATFYSEMSGHQARPVAKDTEGNGNLLINFDGDETITVSGSLDDLGSPIATEIMGGGHLHLGVAGTSGPIAFPLTLSLDDDEMGAIMLPGDNTFTLTAEQVTALYERGYYANFHTDDNPSGEVRGQVMNWAMEYFGSNLAGINENPEAVKTDGGGFVMYERCRNELVVTGSFANLSSDFDANVAGGSHLHLGDAASTGPVFQSLNVDVADDLRSGSYNGDDNTYSLTDDQIMAVRNGGVYFNLHTVDFGSGEIRGQVLRDDNAFPTGPTIITPEDGVTVTVSQGESDLDDGVFNAASDPDGDLLVYTIEVTAPDDTDFTDIIACQKVGTDTLSTATLDAVYDTLIAFGAVPGLSVPLRYRVVASDGSVSTPGPSRTITLVIDGGTAPVDTCNVAGGMLALAAGGTSATVCADDEEDDIIEVSFTADSDTTDVSYVVTDSDGMILGLPPVDNINLEGAGAGTCLIYAISSLDSLTGLTVGASLDSVGGCFALSNAISITRNTGDDCDNEGGEMTRVDSVEMFAILNGLQEVPVPITTMGYGSINVVLDSNELTVFGRFGGLGSEIDSTIAGGAHIHVGVAGLNGPIIFPLAVNFDDDMRGGRFNKGRNTFALTDDQVNTLLNYGMYINVHTVDNAGGEIRGQILPGEADEYFMSNLLGVYEVPAVVTGASGVTIMRLQDTMLTVSGAFSGLMSDLATDVAGGAHIHFGQAGKNGGILTSLEMEIDEDNRGAVFSTDTVYTLTSGQANGITGNRLYVNVHSLDETGGEIRGQIAPLDRLTTFLADLSGHQERPAPVNTQAFGKVAVDVAPDGESIQVSGAFDDLSDEVLTDLAGGAHLHLGKAGESGEVVFPIDLTLDDDNQGATIRSNNANNFAVDSAQLAAFYDRGYYVNVHTPNFEAGEIRGQVLNLANGYFGSNLTGGNAIPETPSKGTGFLVYELAGDELTVSGAFSDLSGDFDASIRGGAHLHLGDASSSGPIAIELDADLADDLRSGSYAADENTYTLTDEQTDALLTGGMYYNLHTTAYPGGEIRGQVLRADNAFPEASMVTAPTTGSTVTVFPDSLDIPAATISTSTDPDGDLVVYSVEFTSASDPDFLNPLATAPLGTDTVFTTVLSGVYDTLRSAGLPVGSSLPISYRILASDGSVTTVGPTGNATIVIGAPASGLARPMINEVTLEGQLELINQSNQTVFFSDYILVRNGEVMAFNEMGIVCGSLRAKAGDLLTVQLSSIDPEGGEIALYNRTDDGAPNELISYLAWGESRRDNQSIAIDQGVWTANSAVGALTAELSAQLVPDSPNIVFGLADPTICQFNQLTVGTSNPAGDLLISYPNPVSKELTIEYAGLRANTTALQLIDIRGRLLLERTIEGRNGIDRLNMAQLPAGTYTLRLANEAGVSVSRIVKQ